MINWKKELIDQPAHILFAGLVAFSIAYPFHDHDMDTMHIVMTLFRGAFYSYLFLMMREYYQHRGIRWWNMDIGFGLVGLAAGLFGAYLLM